MTARPVRVASARCSGESFSPGTSGRQYSTVR
jgi:hypothetical protein